MKRSKFLGQLAAMIGIGAIAPAALAAKTESKPEHKLLDAEKGKFRFATPSGSSWMPYIVHTYYLTADYTVNGRTFIIPLSDNPYVHGDIISPDNGLNCQLYVHENPSYNEDFKCWDYKVSFIPRFLTIGTEMQYPRKYLMPGTLYCKLNHAISHE